MIAWANIKPNEAASFHDVMSEQLAHQIELDEQKLQEKSNSLECLQSVEEDIALKLALEESLREAQSNDITEALPAATRIDPGTDSDLVLAKVLQNEWNKEQNTLLELEERRTAGNSKGLSSVE